MHTFKTGIYLALAVTLSVSACGGGGEEDYVPEDATPVPDPIPNKQAYPPPTTINCPKATYLTYENFGQGFMANYCTSCHGASVPETARGGAPADVNFDTSNDVLVWRKGIIDRTVLGIVPATPNATPTPTATATGTGSGTGSGSAQTPTVQANLKMPPSGHVTATDLASFAEWMNCGAPVGNTHGN